MQAISHCFDAERAESLFFIGVGLAALIAALWCWLRVKTAFAERRGAAYLAWLQSL